jgi:hypothetical protein
MLGFTLTASMTVVEEKLGMDQRIGQSVCCGLGRKPFFSGAVALSNTVDDFIKGCHVRGLLAKSVRVVYVDWYRKRTCHVYQVSPGW